MHTMNTKITTHDKNVIANCHYHHTVAADCQNLDRLSPTMYINQEKPTEITTQIREN